MLPNPAKRECAGRLDPDAVGNIENLRRQLVDGRSRGRISCDYELTGDVDWNGNSYDVPGATTGRMYGDGGVPGDGSFGAHTDSDCYSHVDTSTDTDTDTDTDYVRHSGHRRPAG